MRPSLRARRFACSSLRVRCVVVGMVTAMLSSPNHSIGWAQAETGFAGAAGFSACIAWLASAGVVGGSERRAREDAVRGASAAKLARYYLPRGETRGRFGTKQKNDSDFVLRVPAFFRLAVSAMIAMLLRLLPFGLPTGD